MARGSITKEQRQGKDGKPYVVYVVRVNVAPDPVTGKRRQRQATERTRKDAERRQAEWISEVERGTSLDRTKTTVRELFAQWLDDVAAHAVRASTLNGYRWQIETHILPVLGADLVQRLDAPRVQAFYAAKLRDGASPRLVQLCHQRLSQALNQAVQWKLVPANVCASVKPPTVRYKQGQTWDAEQLGVFLDGAAGDSLHPLWLLLATTGMRRGEALGLRWRDLDLDRGTATIQQSVVCLKGAPVIQPPKTDGSRRTVKLTAEAVDAMKAFRIAWARRKLAAPPELFEDRDLVFCTWLPRVAKDRDDAGTETGARTLEPAGGPINPNNLTRAYDRIIATINVGRKAAGLTPLPRIRVHDLRHTHATLLLQAGTPVKVVSERLGHATISITLDTYGHVVPDMQDRAVEAFSALLRKPGG